MKPTLATIGQFTEQEIFDYVVNHLITQGVPSTDEEGRCRYRGPEGLMCAAGCLISDEEYEELKKKGRTIEGQRWRTVVRSAGATSKNSGLIHRLQETHDRLARDCEPTYPDRLKYLLKRLADERDLNAAAVQ